MAGRPWSMYRGPARFAFHKLLVATLRPAAFQAKAEKDIVQAAQVLEVLVEAGLSAHAE